MNIEKLKKQAMMLYNSLVILDGCYDDDKEAYFLNMQEQYYSLIREYQDQMANHIEELNNG